MTESLFRESSGTVQTANRPVHGSINPSELRALGLNPNDVLDFSASINPLGPPDSVTHTILNTDISKYPDPECLQLREAIANHVNVDPSFVIAGNGSTEIIHLLARAYLNFNSGKRPTSAIFTPTYGEYRGASELMGASIIDLPCNPKPPFLWDFDDIYKIIKANKPSLTFICNPNNPTGVYLDEHILSTLASVVADIKGLLIIDEAYSNLVENRWDSIGIAQKGNTVLLRSMTKDYSLTGIRIGYAIGAPSIISDLSAYQPDWSVNSFAQEAGIAVLKDSDYLARARHTINTNKNYLISSLTDLGFSVPESNANFLLVNTGNAEAWRARLITKGIVVRDCTSFGIPDYIRIGIRSLGDCEKLIWAISEIIKDSTTM